MPKSVLGWVALIIAAVWVFSNPAQAGADVHNAIHGIVTFASSL